MTARTFRIKVRGTFGELTPEQRADLLASAGEHDMLSASFTAEGHLSYDLAARPFFAFRFAESGETDADLAPATQRAEAKAREWLDARGLPYRLTATQTEDMSQAALSKRQRRAQRDA
jgi:hypothetical protein